MKQHKENEMEVNHEKGVTLIKKKKEKLKFKSVKLKDRKSLEKNNKNLTKNKQKKLFNPSGGNYVVGLKKSKAQLDLGINKIKENTNEVKIKKLKKVKRQSTSVISKNVESNTKINKFQDTFKSNEKNVVVESGEKKKKKKPMKSKELLKNGKKGEGQTNKDVLNSTTDEYKPGMLSELLQEKKFGKIIVPWDAAFGMNPKYNMQRRKNEENKQISKLKINPLFDLSKRKTENCTPEDAAVNIIFVGNLPNTTTISTVKRMFRKFGLVLHVKLRSQGFKADKKVTNASVKFNNFESCREALKMNGKEFEGHHLRVTLAKDKVKSDVQNSIFVGNLAFGAEDDELWKVFADCGEIESVRVVRDDRSGKGKGFGYVNFKSEDAVDRALKLDGSSFLNRTIRVSRSTSQATSLSNTDKVKRRRKKKLASGSKSNDGKLKSKLDKSGKLLNKSENILKVKRNSSEVHPKVELPALKKVKNGKKISKKPTGPLNSKKKI